MSLWICDEHGLYGGQIDCPKCGKTGHYAEFHDDPEPERRAWDDLFEEVRNVRRT
jgi:hypothetical protein